MPETTVSTSGHGDVAVISAAGELDVYTSPELRAKVLDQIVAGHQHLVIDLSGVTFMDSSALGVLVGALKRVRGDDGSVRLVCPEERILKIFRITGLTKVFPIYGSVDEALVADT